MPAKKTNSRGPVHMDTCSICNKQYTRSRDPSEVRNTCRKTRCEWFHAADMVRVWTRRAEELRTLLDEQDIEARVNATLPRAAVVKRKRKRKRTASNVQMPPSNQVCLPPTVPSASPSYENGSKVGSSECNEATFNPMLDSLEGSPWLDLEVELELPPLPPPSPFEFPVGGFPS